LDIGANRGDTVEAFLSKQPSSAMATVSGLLAQARADWTPATSCVHGFEASPTWTHILQKLELSGARRVRRLSISTELAVTGEHNLSTVALRLDRSRYQEGTSMIAQHHRGDMVRVPAVNLCSWLRESAGHMARPWVPIVMRMDIEGSEYELLQDLALCGLRRAVGNPVFVGVEWHRFLKERALPEGVRRMMRRLDNATRLYNRARWENYEYKLWAARLDENLEKLLAYQLYRAGVVTNEAPLSVVQRRS